MRSHIFYGTLGLALVGGATAASAQTVITRETVETVRTVHPAHARVFVRHRVVRNRVADRVTTRTIVRERIVPTAAVLPPPPYTDVAAAPLVAPAYPPRLYDTVAPPVAPPPLYDTVATAPVMDSPPLYDVATPVAPPMAAAPFVGAGAPAAASTGPVPSYRYVYEPDRILVIDPYTNVAVQAIPR